MKDKTAKKVLTVIVVLILASILSLQARSIIKSKNQVIEDKESKITSLQLQIDALESHASKLKSQCTEESSEISLDNLRDKINLTEEICLPTDVDIAIDSDYNFSVDTPFCMEEGDMLTVERKRVIEENTTVKQKRTYKLSNLEIDFTREE